MSIGTSTITEQIDTPPPEKKPNKNKLLWHRGTKLKYKQNLVSVHIQVMLKPLQNFVFMSIGTSTITECD